MPTVAELEALVDLRPIQGAQGPLGPGEMPLRTYSGRLTVVSGVPVASADQVAKSTIYFTPYAGNQIELYNGSAWASYTFTERSLALSGLTSGKNYDVFLYDNAGTLTMELGAAWTDNVTRADALAQRDGVYVKQADQTRRYLGTIRATGATTTEDSAGKRFVWNYYNRLARSLIRFETVASWAYTAATFRPWNNSVANRVEWVCGMAEDRIEAQFNCSCIATSTPAISLFLDATSGTVTGAQAAGVLSTFGPSGGTGGTIQAIYRDTPVAGYHFLQAMERGNTGATFFGGSDSGGYRCGIVGSVLA